MQLNGAGGGSVKRIVSKFVSPSAHYFSKGKHLERRLEMKPMLKIFDLLEILNISRATLWRLLNNDASFPKPVVLLGCTRWRCEDVAESLYKRADK